MLQSIQIMNTMNLTGYAHSLADKLNLVGTSLKYLGLPRISLGGS